MNGYKHTINYIKNYILEKYNYLSIVVTNNFFGCKYFKEKYYIFYVTENSPSIYLTYRVDYTIKEKVSLDISSYDEETLKVMIDWIMKKATEKNQSLIKPAKILKNALVSYNGNKEDQCEEISNGEELSSNDNLSEITIDKLSINENLRRLLEKNNIKTLQQLFMLNINEIRKLKGISYHKTKILNNLIDSIRRNPTNYIDRLDMDAKLNDEFIKGMYSKKLITNILEFKPKLKNELIKNKVITIEDLLNLTNDEIKKYGKTAANQILKYKLEILEKNKKISNYKEYLEYIILNYCDEEKSIINLKNFLEKNTTYPVNNLLMDLEQLKNDNKIEYCPNGIRAIKIKLNQLLETLDEEEKEMLIKRFHGKTLSEIAKEYNITRERVRQKLSKYLQKINNVEEDKYKKIFELYNFTKEQFCNIYTCDEIIYYYLDAKYNKGLRQISEALDDYSFTETQKNIIKKICGVIEYKGRFIHLNFDEVIKTIVEAYAQNETRIEELINLYEIFQKDYSSVNLKTCTIRNLEAYLRRCSYVIFGNGNTVRYYEMERLESSDYENLMALYKLEKGYYSTQFLYNNNIDLMVKLNIKNEYELHYISKIILKDKKIQFDRMPNFSVDEANKYKFFKDIMTNLSPISINDFLDYIEINYGHKKTTLYSYLLSKYPEYIKENIIDCKLRILSEEELEKLRVIIKEPIYVLSELEKLLKSAGYKEIDEIITSGNMYKLGYKINSSYILKKDYSGIDEYMKEFVKTRDFIPNENFLKTNAYRNIMKKLEKNLDIFLISKNEYITSKKLNEVGITKENIIQYSEDIKLVMSNRDAFTVQNIRDEIKNETIDELGFEDIFYESIVSNIDEIYSCKIGNSRLYSFEDNEVSLKSIISNIIEENNSIEIIELQETINEKYYILIESSKIKNCIKDTNYYYSEIMNKIYKNKDYYFEEVFNYEQQ